MVVEQGGHSWEAEHVLSMHEVRGSTPSSSIYVNEPNYSTPKNFFKKTEKYVYV